MIDDFFMKWFVEHANPTDEDKQSMRETMLHFLQFMRERKILAEDFSPKSLLQPDLTSPEPEESPS